ncbi:MAG: GNAT family N-acetyltransferase, partial [Erysipelotrichaceae bacterium]|nr:GNAT family N-acetyltransferase [Erysipelotrichaceae bacterium]
MKTQIRTLSEKDLADLAAVAAQIWKECYGEMLSADQIDYMLEQFQSVPAFSKQLKEGYCYRGLFLDDQLIGYTGSRIEGNRVFLSKLYLQKACHGNGYGHLLLEDVRQRYPQADAIWLTVNKHNPTFEMYEHWGFRVTDAVVTDIGEGYVMDDYIM